MMTDQKSVNNQQAKYQVIWHNLPQSVRQEVIVQLVKLLEKHLPVQVAGPKRIEPEVGHD